MLPVRFAVLICALIAAPGLNRAAAADTPTADERAVIDAIEKLGGKADIDSKLSSEARVSAKFEKVTDGVLISLKKYPQIGGVDAFDATGCGEKGFAALKELPNLRKLVIRGGQLSNGMANSISQCKELRHLWLVNCGVNDDEIAAMKKLTLLEHLALSNNAKITDKGMETVKGFERLQVLYLNNISITDKGLLELKALDGLRSLSVKGTKVTADAAEKFPDDMPNLRKVTW
jgi:hypothetical protein